jgi:hypothetical protein
MEYEIYAFGYQNRKGITNKNIKSAIKCFIIVFWTKILTRRWSVELISLEFWIVFTTNFI